MTFFTNTESYVWNIRKSVPASPAFQASFLPLSLFVLEVGYGDSAMPMVDEVDRATPW